MRKAAATFETQDAAAKLADVVLAGSEDALILYNVVRMRRQCVSHFDKKKIHFIGIGGVGMSGIAHVAARSRVIAYLALICAKVAIPIN